MLEVEEAIRIIEKHARWEVTNDSSLDEEELSAEAVCVYFENRENINSVQEGGAPTSFLGKLVKNVARKMRAETWYATCQYTYRPSDVRSILEIALQGPREKISVPRGIDFSPDDFPHVRCDILAAIRSLSESDRTAIFMNYYYGDSPTNGSAERKRLNRAVDRLTWSMNNYRGNTEYVGTRRVITNAHANALISEGV